MNPSAPHRRLPVWSALSLVFLISPPAAPIAAAQFATATVAGSVADSQGLRIPGATVVLVSESRGTTTESVTNQDGDFVFPNIPSDTYTVRVTMEGFKRLDRQGIVISAGTRVTIPMLVIELGALNETVVVTGEAPMIQAQSGERSFTIDTTDVANLPVVSRGFRDYVNLMPGVNPAGGGGAAGQQGRLGGGGQDNIVMDGISIMDTGNNGLMGGLNIPSDMVAEVKVLTSGYQAEYGRSSGLQISAITKSGTNQFRGSVYDVERNSKWNANSWANLRNRRPKQQVDERDWGYTVGGPIGKPGGTNRLSFFQTQYLGFVGQDLYFLPIVFSSDNDFF